MTAMTGARIQAASELREVIDKLRSVRSLICWTTKEVRQIDQIWEIADGLVDHAMGQMMGEGGEQ